MGSNKYITLMFLLGGLLLSFLLLKTGEWVWSYFAKPWETPLYIGAAVVGFGTALVLARRERVYGAASDVVHELEKVTWPSRKETYAATVVVLVTVAISGVILTAFDSTWSYLANLLVR